MVDLANSYVCRGVGLEPEPSGACCTAWYRRSATLNFAAIAAAASNAASDSLVPS